MKLRQLPLGLSFLLLLALDVSFVHARFDNLDETTTPSPHRDRRAAIPVPVPDTDVKRAESGGEEHVDSGAQLTPENFDAETRTNTGWWLVEHFSPWCKHCQAFYPTWLELVKSGNNRLQEGKGPVDFAQIDCSVNGDLCGAHGVRGYPQMNLYHDGEFVEQFKGPRELVRLVEFLDRTVPVPAEAPAATTTTTEAEIKTTEEPVAPPPEAPKPPSTPVLVDTRPLPNPFGVVAPLTSSSFPTYMASENLPVFVKFFAPWCGHCKKLAPIWKQLAEEQRGKMVIAEVNCDDHPALCKQENIKGYPTLVLYTPVGDGKSIGKSEYKQGRKLEQLQDFVAKATQEPTKALTSAGGIELYTKREDVVFVLVYMSGNEEIVAALTPAFTPLLGNPGPILTVEGSSEVYKTYNVPMTSTWAMLVFRDGKLEDQRYLSSDYQDHEHLTRFLLINRIPLSLELNRDTFQAVMNAPHEPLVVLGGKSDGLRDIARGWKARKSASGRGVVFASMDTEKWGDWMTSMYGLTKSDFADKDRVVIANHQDLVYYTSSPSGDSLLLSSPKELYEALDCVILNSAACPITKLHSESRIERLAKTLSNTLEATEAYIIQYPMRFAGMLVVGAILLVLLLQKVGNWLGGDSGRDEEWEAKGRRMD